MNSRKPLFSVLIANYNNGDFIVETIRSIQLQTYSNIEIVIVDDGSNDSSIKIIKEQQIKDNRILLFQNDENKGCGFTKNRCVEVSTGQICGFVDPEDVISVNAIEIMVNDHINNPNVSLVFSNYYHCDENLNVISLRKPNESEGLVTFSQLYERKINHFATFKKSSYLKTNGINKAAFRAVDQDLYIKLEEVGAVFYRNKNLYYYRYHEKGISAFGNNYKALYWYFLVKDETCERRQLSKEDFFSIEYEKLINHYRNTVDYKLGNTILRPIRLILQLWMRTKQVLKK
jgi:glycosyltransferase involved in cell wall biosynthesis